MKQRLASPDALNSRGFFWPAAMEVPVGRLWPEGAVSGQLRIRFDGVSELDLDEILPTDAFLRRVLTGGPVDMAIAGVLHDDGRSVLLSHVRGNGGRIGIQVPSRDKLVANRCLVSSRPLGKEADAGYASLELPLDGYGEWVGRGGVSVEEREDSFTATYPKLEPRRWTLRDFDLELVRQLRGDGGHDLPEIHWRDNVVLRFHSKSQALTIEHAVRLAERIEDLLVLCGFRDHRAQHSGIIAISVPR